MTASNSIVVMDYLMCLSCIKCSMYYWFIWTFALNLINKKFYFIEFGFIFKYSILFYAILVNITEIYYLNNILKQNHLASLLNTITIIKLDTSNEMKNLV